MFKKSFLCVCLAMLSSLQLAHAETACQSIDNILHSISLVQEIQNAKTEEVYFDNVTKLEKLLESILPPALILPEIQDAYLAESRVIYQYISSLRMVVHGAQLGHEEYAVEALGHGASHDFTRSLLSLEAHWNCTPAQLTPQLEVGGHAVFSGGAITQVKKPADKRVNPVLGQSQGRNRPSHSRTTLQRVILDSAYPKGSLELFFLIMCLALILAPYFIMKRSKTIRKREERRSLNMPVNIRMGVVDYTMIMVDISMNGFKIQHPGVIQRKGKLEVKLGEIWYPAQIKWHNKLFAGIRFKKPINQLTFNAVLRSS
ncbi:PilZ domain-containing protein [Hellea sp.]|nr:PilZ domain-containing protein [Hellea sp.]